MKRIIAMCILINSFSFSSETVYIVNAKKYHFDKSCRTLKKAKNIKEISIKNIGNRTPCKVCS